MGMFDSVIVNCPHCGKESEIQSKVGDCVLARYTVKNVPIGIATEINGDEILCEWCSGKYALVASIPKQIEMIIIKR